MLESQRLASQAVAQVLAGRNLNQALQGLFSRHSRLTPQERAAAQDLSYGTLRFYGLLDATLRLLLQKPLQDEDLHCLLLVGLYQLHCTKAAPHAVVDHAVRLTQSLKKPWAKGLVNAVLRNFLRRREALLAEAAAVSEVAGYSHPQWWIDRLRRQYPDLWQRLLEINNQHPPMTLRVNRRRIGVDGYLAMLQQQGLAAESPGGAAIRLARPVPVDKLPGFREGLVSVQDAGAQSAPALLDLAGGMRVLDACAAPGGKAAHLLESADIELTALDNDPARLQKIGDNLARLQLSAQTVLGDAAKPEEWWDGRPFQRILADVPCSASGVVRRHPDIKWLRREEDITQFAAQQAAILAALWRVLERGGKLLYVTCSVFDEENQQQIVRFLDQQPDARRLPLSGLAAADGQLLPDPYHDGFFYALLVKI